MAFKKYQSVEKTEVVSPEGHERISSALEKTGSHSMADLNDAQREQVTDALDDAEGNTP